MTIEDAIEYKRNALEVMRNNAQYATAKATEIAFDALIAILEFTGQGGDER